MSRVDTGARRCWQEPIHHLQAARSSRVAAASPTTRIRIARSSASRTVPHPFDRDRRQAAADRASAAAPIRPKSIAAYRATVERLQRLNETIRREPDQASVTKRATILARLGAADQHAALPVDADRLRAAPRRRRRHDRDGRAPSGPRRSRPACRARPRSLRPRRTRAARRSRSGCPCRSRTG